MTTYGMSACPHIVPLPFDHRLSTFDLAVLVDEANDLPCETCDCLVHQSTGLTRAASRRIWQGVQRRLGLTA